MFLPGRKRLKIQVKVGVYFGEEWQIVNKNDLIREKLLFSP